MNNIISRNRVKRSLKSNKCTRRTISTYQRKAVYSDKHRIRRADAKKKALDKCNCLDTAEMKRRLKLLGIKLDLRLTSAWIAIERELFEEITALAIKSITQSKITKGSRVWWKNAPAFVESWGALEVLKVEGDLVDLELLERLVPLDELTLA